MARRPTRANSHHGKIGDCRILVTAQQIGREESSRGNQLRYDRGKIWRSSPMKLAFFNDFRLGVVLGDGIVDVTGVVQDVPHLGPHDLINGVIATFDTYRERIKGAAEKGSAIPLDEVKLRPPLPRPINVVCMAVNYMEDGTRTEPAPINAFTKSPNAIIGPGDTMELPDVPASVFEGEAEIALVIGKRASKVSAADAMKYVFAYVNFIDGSARGLAPPAGVFYQMKSRYTSAPIVPYIVPADEIT